MPSKMRDELFLPFDSFTRFMKRLLVTSLPHAQSLSTRRHAMITAHYRRVKEHMHVSSVSELSTEESDLEKAFHLLGITIHIQAHKQKAN